MEFDFVMQNSLKIILVITKNGKFRTLHVNVNNVKVYSISSTIAVHL